MINIKNKKLRFLLIALPILLYLSSSLVFGEQVYDSNYSSVYIPDNSNWVYSPITIYGAPADAIVERIDVTFSCTHSWGADLDIDLDKQGFTRSYDLWQNEAGINPFKTVYNIATFNGLPVNGTWYLYARDCYIPDDGYINYWTITIYYTSTAQTYSVNAIIYNLQYGTDTDNDDYYETFDFSIGVDGNVSPGSASIHAKLICNTTGQAWWSLSPWSISGTGTDYQSFSFDETDFSGYISGNTGLDFTVEIWDSNKMEKLATDFYVTGEPVKADHYIPPDYDVYGIVDSLIYGNDVDEDGFYETFNFRIGVDGDVSYGSATIYAKIICNTTSQAWWSLSPWSISGTGTDYHYFEFNEGYFSDYLSVNGNTDLDFTVEIWDDNKSTRLALNSDLWNEPVHADYFSGPPATVMVHGKMEYRDRYYNHHPIRYARVQVLEATTPYDFKFLGETHTDGNGNYSIEVNNIDSDDGSGADIRVEVSSEGVSGAYPGASSNLGIVKPGPEQYYLPWSTYSEIKNDNLKPDLEINLTAETSGSDAGAFSVYDAIVEAFIKTFTIYNQEMPGVTVIWQSDGTYYSPIEDEIHLVTSGCWDRDVILHEYGHFIQDVLNFQNGDIGNNSHHWIYEDLRYYASGTLVNRTDEEAMNLAFSEAWPTFFSISVQYGDNTFPNSGDSIFQSTGNQNYSYDLDADTLRHDSPGEFYEAMNCCTLWDIFDSNNHSSDNNDTLSLGHDEIWNVVKNDKPNKIDDFWLYWFNHYAYKREMTRIFLDHRMSFIAQSPTNPSPPDGSINQPLSLTLDWNDATNATSYDVYLKTTGNFQHIGTTTISAFSLSNLAYYTDYQWQIIAKDGRAEAESPIWSFRTLMEHTVSAPNAPNGPSMGDKNISFNYSTGSAFCSYGHIVQYRFDWGDGTLSDWTTLNTASHSWSEYGTYSIKAQARCANDTSIVSTFSSVKSVTIEKPHVVTTPIIPTGPENCHENITCDYFTGGSDCSYDHNVEYRFDWGDGTFSDWHNLAAASHAWTVPGTYTVRAQARCSVDTGKISAFSQGYIINVTDTCTLSVQSGDITGIPLTVTPGDLKNSGDGNTTFNRIYTPGTEVILTASPTYNDNNFIKWVIDGVEYLDQAVQFTIDHDCTAIVYYYIPPEPEIKIEDGPLNGEEMANGCSYDFGNLKIGYYKQILWVIENEGIVDLELSGASPMEIEGPDSDQFIVVQQPPSVLVPGEGQIFRIHFIPTSEGIKSAKISIVNNDTNENPYEINLSGTGIPEVGIQTIQRNALIALYNSTDGDSWADNSGWKDGELETDGFALKGTEDTWYGVSCSYEGVVTGINLDNNNLMGTIPPELGNIKDLEFLSLYNNYLTGSIPAELGNATDLWSLLLFGNNLVGEIPANLTNLTRLGQTNIGYNGLYTNDEDIRSFFNSKDSDWENTQTIAPTGLNAAELSNYYITLEWNPILYTGQSGGYRVYHSTTSGGPYTFFASTSDKTVTSMQVTELSPGTNYYFVVQTRTESSAYNSNVIDSEYSVELSASTTSDAAIHLISPNGGETWEVNSIHDITWTSYGLSGNIKIEYSTDDGNTWKTITSSTENDGSYAWSIPYDASNQCKIRLGYGGTSFMDTSDNMFSIVLPGQLIVVTSPNGGETWYAGSTVDITWISHGPIGTLLLDYSTDNGSTWNVILYTNENDGSHPWNIPYVQSNQCLVRISQSGGVPSDTSDAVFTIIDETPRITVTAPNGGEVWPARSYRYITWTSEYVSGNVKIEYSTNSGFTWKEIAASTENDGIHPWSVPNDPAQICYLRISEIDGEPSDESDYPFTIDYPPSQQISEIERITLIDLYNSTNGDNWINNSGWKTPPLHSDGFAAPGTEYTWHGVSTEAYWHVIRIELSDNNLTGTLPETIGNLSDVYSLDLARNQITGTIPASTGNLSNLLYLHLESNQLVGTIPAALGNLTNLSYLYVYDNQLTGTIPAELENLSNLRSLALNQNNLSGNIPSWIGNLSNLQGLFLLDNNFTGAIPSSLGNLSNLMSLLLSGNNLTGSIPAELGNLSSLSSLSLLSNQLSGSIPPELGNLSNLNGLYLNDNRLSGNIPEELGNLTNLNTLKLQSNKLSGNIPIALSSLTGLGELWTDIGYNALYTDNETLRTFLNEKDSDWENTQTIAPLDVTASPLSADSILLNWTPITYIQDPGGYSIHFSTTQGGPYTHYNTTIGKTVSSMTVTGLNPGMNYYFIVQSVTDPHADNQNEVISEECPEVSAATLSLFYIQVTYPNGDESLEAGSLQNITWNTVGPVGDVSIEYSSDSGSTWTEIVASTMNDGIHPWTVPGTVSPQCLIRINEVAGSLTDTSNQLFSIVPVPAITITSPTGGESFEVGSSHNITWSTIGEVGNVKIEYSTDNGSSWADLVTSMANIGIYSWTIPDTVSSECRIRISELDGSPASINNSAFSIVPQPSLSLSSPNGGESLEVRSKQGITWSTVGNISNVKLEYSTNSGSDWSEITPNTENDGFNLWQIPDTVSSQCLLKISGTGGGAVDVSDAPFSIIPEPTISIVSPDGGELFEVTSTQNITWTSTGNVGNVKIEYSSDNGANWSEIISSTVNSGSYSWVIPDTVASQCLVRISETDGEPIDTSTAIFSIVPGPSITINSPNGGETFIVNSITNLSWNTTGTVGNVTIEYSSNNGSNWIEVISSTENDGSHEWTIPNTVSSQYLLRVTELDGNPSDTSDSIFSVESSPAISITSPNGGETFEVGSNHTITWSTTGTVGDVKIEYSSNNGSTWIEITASTENDGLFTWTIPDTVSSQCLVEISELNGDASDSSDSVFSIVPIPLIPASERNALIDLYNSTDGDNWTNNSGWKEPPLHDDGFALPGTEDSWVGISTESNHIIKIELANNNLSGTIPDSIDNLSGLLLINLSQNQLDGNIPASTGNLANLKFLNLSQNQFTGGIPAVLSNLANLVGLYLNDNQFSGNVPIEIGSFSKLLYLDLHNNHLSGSIPPEIGNLLNLQILKINSNKFTGIIPGSISNLSGLSNSDTDIGYNAVYTDDSDLEGFLNDKDPAWLNTQTIAPSNVSATALSENSIEVTWDPIPYTGDSGGYRVLYSNNVEEDFNLFDTTIDKTTNSMVVTGLTPNTPYYFVLQTRTDPHQHNQNTIDSGYSNRAFISTTPIPTIVINSPNGGETWEIGSVQNITWTTTGIVGNVKIEYSTNNGTDWTEIFVSTDNDGIQAWTIPDTPSSQCLVKISELDGSPTDISDGTFTIVQSPIISGYVTSSGVGLANVVMNGLPGNPITDGSGFYTAVVSYGWSGTVTPTLTGYTFTEPSTTYTGIISDQSTDYTAIPITFTISGFVTSGGTGLANVVMNGLPGTPVTDAGGFYTAVVNYGWSGTATPTLSNYTFTPPAATYTSVTSDQTTDYTAIYVPIPEIEREALIDLYNSTGGDSWTNNSGWKTPPLHSDGFAMPGTETLWFGVTIENNHITAIDLPNNNLSGNMPPSICNLYDLVNLDLSSNHLTGNMPPDLGNLINTTRLTLSSNQLSGIIPNSITSLSGLADLAIGYNALYTDDNNVRTFLDGKAPNWEDTQTTAPTEVSAVPLSATSVQVSWIQIIYTADPGGYRVLYSTIAGEPYTLFDTTIDKTVSSMTVTGLTPSTTYFFVVATITEPHADNQNTVISHSSKEVPASTFSDPPFIIVTSPNGGETWEAGSSHPITWTTEGVFGDVKIEYSTDGGLVWSSIALFTNNDGLYDWIVPDNLSDNCFIRVSQADSDEGLSDISDTRFSIISPSGPTLRVTAPNGGENITAASTCEISWIGSGIDGEITIEYSTDNGESWTAITTTTNTGIYNWTVPAITSANCLVLVKESDGEPVDVSDGIFSIIPQASVSVISPNGGENWEAGSSHAVTWSSSGNVGNLKIDYSTDNGTSWINIVLSTANDGIYDWSVPGALSNNCLVRISESGSDSGVFDVSDALFSIVSPAEKNISVVSPNGGESLEVGTLHTITWTSSGILDDVRLEYSTDNGNSWQNIVTSTANYGNHNWFIPDTPSEHCLIRVSEADVDEGKWDISDAVFSIVPASNPGVRIESPNGGEAIITGNTYKIKWTTSGTVGNLNIEYSIDKGNSWISIVTSTENTGTFDWTVPDNPSEDCLIRIVETDGEPADTSDGLFSIISPPSIIVTSPNGGECWEVGSLHNLTWTGSSYIPEVKIEFSADNGTNWTGIITAAANANSFSWTVPDVPSEDCLIRISGISNVSESVNDVSDAPFSIIPSSSETITVITPNGGEKLKADFPFEITWTSTGNIPEVNIEYSTDRGESWTIIAADAENNGFFNWTVPADPVANCLLKISDTDGDPSDTSDADFSISPGQFITITSPNGGESLEMASTFDITWTCSDMTTDVKIEYSTDNGTSWTDITQCPGNDRSFNWTVPGTLSDECLIRISELDTDDGISDVSDAVFSISAAAPLRLLSPNVDETLQAGNTYLINWESNKSFENIKLEYSIDNGAVYHVLNHNAPDTGNYEWYVPYQESANCLVRISNANRKKSPKYILLTELKFKISLSASATSGGQAFVLWLGDALNREIRDLLPEISFSRESNGKKYIQFMGNKNKTDYFDDCRHSLKILTNLKKHTASLWFDDRIIFKNLPIKPESIPGPSIAFAVNPKITESAGIDDLSIKVFDASDGVKDFVTLFTDDFEHLTEGEFPQNCGWRMQEKPIESKELNSIFVCRETKTGKKFLKLQTIDNKPVIVIRDFHVPKHFPFDVSEKVFKIRR